MNRCMDMLGTSVGDLRLYSILFLVVLLCFVFESVSLQQTRCKQQAMLGIPNPTTVASVVDNGPAASPSNRPSRLRALSYLRSVTQTLSPRSEGQPPLSRSTSSPDGSSLHLAAARAAESPPAVPNLPEFADRPVNDSDSGSSPSQQRGSNMTRRRAVTALVPTVASLARSPSGLDNSLPSSPSTMQSAAQGSSLPQSTSLPSHSNGTSSKRPPSIRLVPHTEPRSTRPSLPFVAVTRTLRNSTGVVRVGRYSEKDHAGSETAHLHDPDDTNGPAPIGFKSKVVSRRHCEFWCDAATGQWSVKDVGSSSGTFLNHVRLSSPGHESRGFPVRDGDVVQLGIDFKGGEEVIFRCVKIRVECNRDWQKSLNPFNTAAHRRILRNAGVITDGGAKKKKSKTDKRQSDAGSIGGSASMECSICLNSVAPWQALFVAPCSHVWHYKCIRDFVHGPTWPQFLCPNCRFVSDLEADVDEVEQDFDDADEEEEEEEAMTPAVAEEAQIDALRTDQRTAEARTRSTKGKDNTREANHQPHTPSGSQSALHSTASSTSNFDAELAQTLEGIHIHHEDPQAVASSFPIATASTVASPVEDAQPTANSDLNFSSRPIAIAKPNSSLLSSSIANGITRTGTFVSSHTADSSAAAVGAMLAGEGPMTPRNEAGPFVLDGSGAGLLNLVSNEGSAAAAAGREGDQGRS